MIKIGITDTASISPRLSSTSLYFGWDCSVVCSPLCSWAAGIKMHFLWYLSGAERSVQHVSLAHYRLVGRDTNSTPTDSRRFIHRLEHIEHLWSHISPLKTHTHVCTHAVARINWLAFANGFIWPPYNHGKKEWGRVQGEKECEGSYWVTESAVLVMVSSRIIPAGGKQTHWCLALRMLFLFRPFCLRVNLNIIVVKPLSQEVVLG